MRCLFIIHFIGVSNTVISRESEFVRAINHVVKQRDREGSRDLAAVDTSQTLWTSQHKYKVLVYNTRRSPDDSSSLP